MLQAYNLLPLFRSVVPELFVVADPFHFTQNSCEPLRFVKAFPIIEKLDSAASWHEHLNRPGKNGCGLPPIAVTKIK